jgi:hypothetical protein
MITRYCEAVKPHRDEAVQIRRTDMHDIFSDDIATTDDRMYAAAEQKYRADILGQMIKWLQTKLVPEEQRLLMLDLMTYESLEMIPDDEGWTDRVLRLLRKVLSLRQPKDHTGELENILAR